MTERAERKDRTMASELVYLRDLDGTGSMHICASGDDGAIAYAPASPRPAPEYAGLVEGDEYDIAASATNHADKVLRAAGSALKHYTTPSIKKAILSAMLDAIEEAYRAGANLVIARTSDLSQRNKALEAEVERLRGLLEAIKADCQSTIDLYERNGPSFTSQATGDEYEPASFVQNKMHELLNIAALGDHP